MDEFGKENNEKRVTGTLPRRNTNGHKTGTLPRASVNDRVTGTLPRASVNDRVTGTLPRASVNDRVTGTLPKASSNDRVTSTLPRGNDRDFDDDLGKHRYTLSQGTFLRGEKDVYLIIGAVSFGGQAEVYTVADQNIQYYIAKIYFQGKVNKYHDDIVDFLKNCKQPGIIKLIDTGIINERTLYIFPRYEKGSIDGLNIPFTELRLKKYIKILNEAVNAVHKAGLIHADIKPANILYDEENDIPVLSDFGSITKGDVNTENIRSITGAEKRVSEGYTAPISDKIRIKEEQFKIRFIETLGLFCLGSFFL